MFDRMIFFLLSLL